MNDGIEIQGLIGGGRKIRLAIAVQIAKENSTPTRRFEAKLTGLAAKILLAE